MIRKHPPSAAHLRVRLASGLLARLEHAARRNNHSMNAEIIARLERSFAKEDTASLIEQVAERTAGATGSRLERALASLLSGELPKQHVLILSHSDPAKQQQDERVTEVPTRRKSKSTKQEEKP